MSQYFLFLTRGLLLVAIKLLIYHLPRNSYEKYGLCPSCHLAKLDRAKAGQHTTRKKSKDSVKLSWIVEQNKGHKPTFCCGNHIYGWVPYKVRSIVYKDLNLPQNRLIKSLIIIIYHSSRAAAHELWKSKLENEEDSVKYLTLQSMLMQPGKKDMGLTHLMVWFL